MRRCLGKACAGVLMLAAAGCFDTFLSQQVVVYGPKVIVPGTVGEVAAKLQDGLSDAGVLKTKRMGNDFRICSMWKKRTVFCLHLTQKKDAGGNKTLVRMQWDRGGDEELWQYVLKILNAPAENDDTTSPQVKQG
jgi:hypothetical protein